MISDQLLSLVCCPDCHGELVGQRTVSGGAIDLTCQRCGRQYPGGKGAFLDLRSSVLFAEMTKYLDDALHADARHETVSPPFRDITAYRETQRFRLG